MRRLLGLALLACVSSVVFACATEDTPDVQPLSSSKKNKGKSSGDDDDTAPVATTPMTSETAAPVVPVDAGGGSATTYVGTLDTTTTVRFGGSPYCSYDVTLKAVKIEVAALPDGSIIGASVKDTMVEASVPPCTLSPAPPADCSFAFTKAMNTATGVQLAFKGASTNHPATELLVDLTKTGASYEAAAKWRRTDQDAPLAWTVTTKITLGPR